MKIGSGVRSVNEALFIRHFTDDLTLFCAGRRLELTEHEREILRMADIRLFEYPVSGIRIDDDRSVVLTMPHGLAFRFDILYSMLGTQVQSQ